MLLFHLVLFIHVKLSEALNKISEQCLLSCTGKKHKIHYLDVAEGRKYMNMSGYTLLTFILCSLFFQQCLTSAHIHSHIVLQLQSNFFISLVVMIIIFLQRITVLMMMDYESTTFSAPNVFIIDYLLDGIAYMFYFSIFAKVRLLRFRI